MKKRLPRLDESITVNAHGANKLHATWFKALSSTVSDTDAPIIIGIDEAGRGPVFGPMVVGASCNLTGWFMAGIKDSKLIKQETVRRSLASEIQHNTIWSTAVITAEVINRFNTIDTLRVAGQKVAAEMIKRVRQYYPTRLIRLIFDGRDHPNRLEDGCEFQSIEKADATVFECSCASIIAKVLHDNLIHDIVKSDPQRYGHYDLGNCKGYGTPKHRIALEQFGRTDQHRREATDTFLGLNNGKTCQTAVSG